jgi:hypothetical protein
MSWLSKFGRLFKIIFADAVRVEKAVEPYIEAVVPATVPAFNVFDHAVEVVKDVEAAFAAAGVVQGGEAKLAAAMPSIGLALDAYTAAKFPGSDAVLRTEAYLAAKKGLINAVVAYLNAIPESVTVAPSSTALIAATAAAAAVNASKPLTSTAG